MKKQGAIILGTGGDGSDGGTGTFFEGAITKGCPPDSIDDKIQANIVAAGYGVTKVATSLVKHGGGGSSQTIVVGSSMVSFSFSWTGATTVSVTGLPAGILATIDKAAQTVTFSGAPTAVGTFVYTTSTVGGSPDTSKVGTFTVTALSSSSVASSSSAATSSSSKASSSSVVVSSSTATSSNSVVSSSSVATSSAATSPSNASVSSASTTIIASTESSTRASILFTNGTLYSKGVQGQLEVFTIYGKRVATCKATDSGSNVLNLLPGVYIVRAEGFTAKFAVAGTSH